MTTVITAHATFDQTSYNVGDTITVTVVASAVSTVPGTGSSQVEQLSLTGNLVAADGTKSSAILLGPVPITINTPSGPPVVTQLTATIDTSAGNTITDNTGRVYTVSADKMHLTAVA